MPKGEKMRVLRELFAKRQEIKALEKELEVLRIRYKLIARSTDWELEELRHLRDERKRVLDQLSEIIRPLSEEQSEMYKELSTKLYGGNIR